MLDLVNFGDGVKILDQFLPVHADAAVDDGKRARSGFLAAHHWRSLPSRPPAIVVAVALKPLQRAGFVAVRVDPADRRSRLSLSPSRRIVASQKRTSITKSLKEDIYDGK